MEPVDLGQPFPVFIDYAHTDDGLLQALHAVRALDPRRKLVVVFGCGGDRDRGKRPLMGKTAGQLADLVVVTSDNPRSEDPQAIMAAIEEGLRASGNGSYRMLPDRRDAIHRTISIAGADWSMLIAGKGNETGQEVAGVETSVLRPRRGGPRPAGAQRRAQPRAKRCDERWLRRRSP